MTSTTDRPVPPASSTPSGSGNAADPYPDHAFLRADAVRRVTLRPGLEPWLITRYDDIRAVLGSGWVSNDPANASAPVREALATGGVEERVALLGKNLMSLDPPDHTRMRRLLSGAFTARRLAVLAEPITARAEHLLDALTGRQEADLLADYTFPLSISVVCRLMGFPESDQPLLSSWGRALIHAALDDAATFTAVMDEMGARFLSLIYAKRDRPGDDLISVLVTARDDERLDDDELISLLYQFFFAGHESSAYFMSNAVLLLLTHPDQRAKLAENPDLLPSAIEEMLRLEGSVKVPSWRFATHPIPIGDVVIEPGEAVLAYLPAGGRDESKHSVPDQFLIDRPDTDHLAFGYGIHRCIGSALARLESRIAISRLLARYPEIHLARPVAALRWRVSLVMRGLCELPVRLTAASS